MDSLEQYFVQLGASSFILVSDNACSPLPPAPIRRTADEETKKSILLDTRPPTAAAALLLHDRCHGGRRGAREKDSSPQLLRTGRDWQSLDRRRSAVYSWRNPYVSEQEEEKEEELHDWGSYRWDSGPQLSPRLSLSKTNGHEDIIENSPLHKNENSSFTEKKRIHGVGNDVNLVMPQRSTSQESLLSYLCERG